MEYLFQFNDKFEIHDDLEVLKQIGMLMGKSLLFKLLQVYWNYFCNLLINSFVGLDEGKCSPEKLEKLKSLVPKALEEYVIRKSLKNPSETE